MKQAVAELPLGVEILNVYMREACPPIEVVPNYRAVASARERKNKIVHSAHTYANAVLPLSRGQVAKDLALAETEAHERVCEATGEVQSFLLKEQIFSQTESVQRVRLWWNTIEAVLRDKVLYILPKNMKHRVYSREAQKEVFFDRDEEQNKLPEEKDYQENVPLRLPYVPRELTINKENNL
jgi:regulator of protease activity HflC (stomatin/prohibitin superfamily)